LLAKVGAVVLPLLAAATLGLPQSPGLPDPAVGPPGGGECLIEAEPG
jgi:hypothetical protein